LSGRHQRWFSGPRMAASGQMWQRTWRAAPGRARRHARRSRHNL